MTFANGKQRASNARRIYAMPAVLGAVSGVGLVTALVWDGPIDNLSGLAVAFPLLVVAWKIAQSWLISRLSKRQ